MRFVASKICGSLVALAFLSGAALADPVGSYRVEGKGPDGGIYKGTATVEATGETYRMVWLIGKDKFVGTGVGNDEFFAVSYKSGANTGIAVYGKEGDSWIGVWTYFGGTSIGAEKLTPR